MDEHKFIVRMYHYIGGQLQIFVAEFNKFEDAIEHGIKSLCHRFKIFNKDGHICHDSDDSTGNYA